MREFTPERWRTLMPVLDAVLAMAPADRPAWLGKLADRDPELATDIAVLLRQHADLDEERFLDPSTDVIHRILAEGSPIALALQPGDVIGTYQLLRPLGSGGMGVVWLAQQVRPIRRLVALKTARPGSLPRELAARLAAERQALAILDHPGVAKVFDAGETRDGIPYFVMEYIDGAPITEYCDGRCMPLDDRLRLFADVCDAVDHAHSKGLLHRDLKPRNILVSGQGDRHVARIIDFGIAKSAGAALTDHTVYTQIGAVLGTPAYMSPEQAGEIDAPVDERTDVYSLGVILHELLSGVPPTRPSARDEDLVPRLARGLENDTAESAQQIARNRSDTPAALQRQLTGELQWIVGKAIRRVPADRYGSVAALRADVNAHLAGRPIVARSPSVGERLERLIRLHKTAVAAAFLLPVAVASGALVSSLRSSSPGDAASVAPGPPAAAASMPVPLTSYPGIEADPAWSPDGQEIAFVWNGEAETDFDLYVLRVGDTQPRRLTFDAGPDVKPVWSPDGQWIAYERPGGEPGVSSLHVVAATGGAPRTLLSHPAPVGTATWSRDSKTIIVHMMRTSRRVSDLWVIPIDGGPARQITRAPDDTIGDQTPALSPDGRTVAFCRKTAWRTAELYLLDLAPDLTPIGEPRQVTQVGFAGRPAWTPDGSRVLFEASGKGAGIWQLDVATERVSPVIGPAETASQPALVKRTDGSTALAFTNQVAEISIWRYATRDPGAAPVRLVPSTRSEFLPQFSHDGARVAFSSTRTGSPEIWIADAEGGGLRQLTSLGHLLADMGHWSPDDRWITFVTQDPGGRHLYIVSAAGGPPERIITADVSGNGSGWSHDGRFYYYTSARSGQREVWRVEIASRSHERLTSGGADRGFESGRGTFYYWSVTGETPTLRRRTPDGDEDVRITPRPHPLELTVTSPAGFYYRSQDSSTVYHYDEVSGRSSRVIDVPRAMTQFTVSPDGAFVAASFLDRNSVDLMLIERFR